MEAQGGSGVRCGPGNTGRFSRVTAVAGRGFDATGYFDTDHVPGGNFSGWRHVLAASCRFDESLGVGAALLEETELCLRVREAGYRVVFNGAACLTHLRATEGGCRVSDVPRYVHSLARNRSVIIRRHIPPPFWPIALGRSILYGLSYAVAYGRPTAFGSSVRGMIEGWVLGAVAPLCTGGR